MNWKIRHEGSPVAVEDLTLPQVIEGLQDGRWEPTDEVMGPDDREWTAIENHVQLAEVATDLEPPPAPSHDDETHLDMNALIDVTLVLLIFFILTTSYAALQKILESPKVSVDDKTGALVVTEKQVAELMIRVRVTMEGGQPVIRVEDRVVDEEALLGVLAGFTRGDQRKTDLLLECDPEAPREIPISIQDKAKGAGIQRVYWLVPKSS
jgi:biopolymer transport protein ExbD